MRRSLALIALALCAWGCGARTELLVATDVVTADATDVVGDRAERDVPFNPDGADVPDAPPSRCTRDSDCAGTPATPHCDISSGVCVECVRQTDCPPNEVCLGGRCASPCGAGQMCGVGEQCCGAVCVNTQDDPNNCDGCDVRCVPGPHASAVCRAGHCLQGACDTGFADCDGNNNNGCETAVFTDPFNCGGCGRSCAAGEACSGGVCVGTCQPGAPGCAVGQSCCASATGATTCTNTQSDPNHCGRCETACMPVPNATVTCSLARCVIGRCTPGFADCDGVVSNGCEVQLATDHNNCGSCGIACGDEESCNGGICGTPCRPGGNCGVGMCCVDQCVNTQSDPNHCGDCNTVCGPAPNATVGCGGGRCAIAACNTDFGDCNGLEQDGCETSLVTSLNCGGCGIACGPNSQCVSGVCRSTLGCGNGPPCSPGQQCCGDACVSTQTDTNNCGGCGQRCGPGQSCVRGLCQGSMGCPGVPCGVNQGCCAGTCTDVRGSDPNNCGGCNVRCPAGFFCMAGACCQTQDAGGTCGVMVCPGTQFNCSGTCRDLNNDPSNCGGCDLPCIAGQTCVGGTCRGCGLCPTGDLCCNDQCTNTTNDAQNCGGCGLVCPPNSVCVNGGCVPQGGCVGGCPAGDNCCGSVCIDIGSDPNNCGGCGIPCRAGANAMAVCNAGVCGVVCARGFADCDGNPGNGCEANTGSDATNCGGCGTTCLPGSSCVNGTCQGCECAPPRICCGGSSVCIDPTNDTNHCGGCNTACTAPANATSFCMGGMCGFNCNRGFADCDGVAMNGCESDSANDANNCGGCNIRCPAGMACVMGSCASGPSTGAEGAFLPVANPTYLSPGIHNFTTITIPAGSVVFVAGAGAQSATLDLRANGHVQIDGTIDVSGGPGTQSIVASRTTAQGKAGSGGYTGEGTSAPQPMRACEFAPGEPGLRGAMVSGSTGTCTVFSSGTCTDRSDPRAMIFTSPLAQFGGGGGVFTGFRAYGAGGGGFAGGGGGALGRAFAGEQDCSGVTGGGGAGAGQGGRASVSVYNGADGVLGQTECDAVQGGVDRAWVGGGGGGSIGSAAANDLAVNTTFQPGSGGGGGSADYLQRPAFGGTSGGGGGGGALRIWTSADIVVTGSLLANGGTGGDAYIGTPGSAGCDPQPGAAGGGGSGGLIYLKAPVVSVAPSASVAAAGGLGGAGSVFATGGSGGDGGLGRIRISATPGSCTLAGSFTPALVSGCTPTTTPTPGRAYVGAYPN